MTIPIEALPRNLLAFGRGARRHGFESEHGRQLSRLIVDAHRLNYHAGIVYGQAMMSLASVIDLETRRPRWEVIVLAIETLLEEDATRETRGEERALASDREAKSVPDEAWPNE